MNYSPKNVTPMINFRLTNPEHAPNPFPTHSRHHPHTATGGLQIVTFATRFSGLGP